MLTPRLDDHPPSVCVWTLIIAPRSNKRTGSRPALARPALLSRSGCVPFQRFWSNITLVFFCSDNFQTLLQMRVLGVRLPPPPSSAPTCSVV